MKKLEWSDEQLVALLRKMPKLQDRRRPQEIYNSLILKIKRRKKRVWVIPSTAALGAFLLLLLLTANLSDNQGNSESKLKVVSISANSLFNYSAPDNEKFVKMDAKPRETNARFPLTNGKTAVYQDVGNGKVLTYWIPNQKSQILVPVSTVNHLRGKTWLELLLYNNEKKSEMNVDHERNRAYLFYYPVGKKVPFLVPSDRRYPDIKSAFEAMDENNARIGLRASIPSGLKVSFLMVKNKTLYLTVAGNYPLKNTAEAVYSYEALLLTAKDFGLERVKLENPYLKHLGPFDLSKENNVPVAANLNQIEN